MPKKVTVKKVLEAIENNEDGLLDYELAKQLNISSQHFSNIKREYIDDFVDMSKRLAKLSSTKQIRNLERNADKGDTSASRLLLEIGKVHEPQSKFKVDGTVKHEGSITYKIINYGDKEKDAEKE